MEGTGAFHTLGAEDGHGELVTKLTVGACREKVCRCVDVYHGHGKATSRWQKDSRYILLAQVPSEDRMPVRRRRSIADYSPATTNDYVLCAAVESARKIGNQWRLIVVRYLLERPMRFNELRRLACGIDPKTLSRVLKYLTG